MPGKDGLLHISQIAHERVEKVTDYLKEGQIVKVKVLETDEKGRVKLSMKALLDRDAQPAASMSAAQRHASRAMPGTAHESHRNHVALARPTCCALSERPDAGGRRRRGADPRARAAA